MNSPVKIRAIITGVTGMVGEGVLHECLLHPQVEAVLVLNRRPCGITHPKLKEIIHKDFFGISAIERQLTGYNACFFCLGVSSVGMKEPEYYNELLRAFYHQIGAIDAYTAPLLVGNVIEGSMGQDTTTHYVGVNSLYNLSVKFSIEQIQGYSGNPEVPNAPAFNVKVQDKLMGKNYEEFRANDWKTYMLETLQNGTYKMINIRN